VIRPVEEDSFDRARFVFFAGSPEFTRANFALAQRSAPQSSIFPVSPYRWRNRFLVSRMESLRGQPLPAKLWLATIPSAAAEA